jgi:hypothetical protein
MSSLFRIMLVVCISCFSIWPSLILDFISHWDGVRAKFHCLATARQERGMYSSACINSGMDAAGALLGCRVLS